MAYISTGHLLHTSAPAWEELQRQISLACARYAEETFTEAGITRLEMLGSLCADHFSMTCDASAAETSS